MTDPNPDALFQFILQRLESESDEEFAKGQRRFFRHEVETLGVRSDALRRVERELGPVIRKWPVAARNRLMQRLWEDGRIETGALVCYLYRRFERTCGACEFKLFERWIDRYVRNWAHCDGVASWLVAAAVRNEPELMQHLVEWTGSANPWKRRAAAVGLLQEAKAGRNFDTIAQVASHLIEDPDRMVQMGLGWLLKEAYVKQPERTEAFLTGRRAPASRLTLRIAAEKMPADARLRVLSR